MLPNQSKCLGQGFKGLWLWDPEGDLALCSGDWMVKARKSDCGIKRTTCAVVGQSKSHSVCGGPGTWKRQRKCFWLCGIKIRGRPGSAFDVTPLLHVYLHCNITTHKVQSMDQRQFEIQKMIKLALFVERYKLKRLEFRHRGRPDAENSAKEMQAKVPLSD